MSKPTRPRLSLKGDPNALTTAPIEQAQVAPNAPLQETPMPTEQTNEKPEGPSELTAKEMAAQEELNAARAKHIAEANAAAAAAIEEPTLIQLAAQGRDALMEGIRQHNERNKPKAYVPPPRTVRQMSQLEEELEAGRRAQQRAQAQFDVRPQPAPDPKEGFTTPAYRPGDFVPGINSKDPAITR